MAARRGIARGGRRSRAAGAAPRRAGGLRARAARGRSAGRAGALAGDVRPRSLDELAAVRAHPRRIARPRPGHGRSGRGLSQERLRTGREGTAGLPAARPRIPEPASARGGARLAASCRPHRQSARRARDRTRQFLRAAVRGLGRVRGREVRCRGAAPARARGAARRHRRAMDRVWEEEAVRFGAEMPKDDCSPNGRAPERGTASRQVQP